MMHVASTSGRPTTASLGPRVSIQGSEGDAEWGAGSGGGTAGGSSHAAVGAVVMLYILTLFFFIKGFVFSIMPLC